MHRKIDILSDTLEGMAADAEDKGKDTIQPMLTLEDVKEICQAIRLTTPVTVCCEDKEKRQDDLAVTVDSMTSPDYKERFRAEFHQTKVRYTKLHNMLIKADAGTLDFTPTCPLELLRDQKAAMGRYLYCLEVRAEIEKISLY